MDIAIKEIQRQIQDRDPEQSARSNALQPQGSIIHLTEAQLGHRSYPYPDDDHQEALGKVEILDSQS